VEDKKKSRKQGKSPPGASAILNACVATTHEEKSADGLLGRIA